MTEPPTRWRYLADSVLPPVALAAGSVEAGNVPIVPAAWQSPTNYVQSVDYNVKVGGESDIRVPQAGNQPMFAKPRASKKNWTPRIGIRGSDFPAVAC